MIIILITTMVLSIGRVIHNDHNIDNYNGTNDRMCDQKDHNTDNSHHLIYPVVWLTVGAPLWILQPAFSTPRSSQLSVAVYSIEGQSTL